MNHAHWEFVHCNRRSQTYDNQISKLIGSSTGYMLVANAATVRDNLKLLILIVCLYVQIVRMSPIQCCHQNKTELDSLSI